MKTRTTLIYLPLLTLLWAYGVAQPTPSSANKRQSGPKNVMLMNRIGPSVSELYLANTDGTAEHKLLPTKGFDYHPSFSADGKWIVFTSERAGDGQADIYRVHLDGTELEQLTNSTALDDQATLSPDGTQLAFVSTREQYLANIWLLNLKTRKLRNLTGQEGIAGAPNKPNGYFRPAWSPDGKWLAFSSDRNTEWKGHSNGAGWEHVQELRVYLIKPDGTGLRKISRDSVCSGSPKWSSDGRRVVFYEMPVEDTWNARTSFGAPKATAQIVSVDVHTGQRTVHTTGQGLKLVPQFVTADNIGFMAKAGPNEGIGYTNGKAVKGKLRSPAWSADGKLIVYERQDWKPRLQNQLLYSWDSEHEYRYTDVFPSFSVDGKLLLTEKNDNSSIAVMDADGSNRKRIFDASGKGEAFSPGWSPDDQSVVFGVGGYFQNRTTRQAKLMLVKRDGTGLKDLTDGTPNAGFPSFSPDGKHIVYRVWGNDQHGLRIMNVEDRSVQVLTKDYDNVPYWSPDGTKILFTRKHEGNNFDVFTITPDGKQLTQLTTAPTNDAHAVWTDDGKHILWNSGEYGFREETALLDNTFQPYGTIWMMNADGTHKRALTDSPWEDSMPRFVPQNTHH
ncbi:TolB family protein [Spirosoma flavum]|uniref:TolB family protein n=1 Tax=Spirosoma flavum TaxID=2048557 RepID=A0ABW6APU9_9BACT